jgi:hypothetical protein
MLVSLGIVTVVVFLVYIKSSSEGFTTEIPKQIWTYWDNPETVPNSVKLCMESWRKCCPTYSITLLTKANYSDYVTIPAEIANHPNMNDMPQRFADLVRCWVVAQNGGVWIDSSTILGQPLDDWLYVGPAELYAFTIVFGNNHNRMPIIENWFFAAPKQSSFMKAWRDEFSELARFPTNQAYIDSRVKMGVDVKDWSSTPNYLTMHVAAQKVLQIDKYPLDKLMLWPSEKGPYRYLVENDWNNKKALESACSNMKYRTPFMKLRGAERSVLESALTTSLSNEKCKWVE